MLDHLSICGHRSKSGYWVTNSICLLAIGDGIPLVMALTKANQVEQSVAQLLVAEADNALLADNLQWLVFLVANAGYDGKSLLKIFLC